MTTTSNNRNCQPWNQCNDRLKKISNLKDGQTFWKAFLEFQWREEREKEFWNENQILRENAEQKIRVWEVFLRFSASHGNASRGDAKASDASDVINAKVTKEIFQIFRHKKRERQRQVERERERQTQTYREKAARTK